MLACQLSSETRILNAMQNHVQVGTSSRSDDSASTVNELRTILNELSIRLDSTFQLTTEQTVRQFLLLSFDIFSRCPTHGTSQTNIRRVCQELIFKPLRVAYKSLHHDAEVCCPIPFFILTYIATYYQKMIRAKASHYRMDNIFGKPSREEKWITQAKRIASSVRNSFRQDVSIFLNQMGGCSNTFNPTDS